MSNQHHHELEGFAAYGLDPALLPGGAPLKNPNSPQDSKQDLTNRGQHTPLNPHSPAGLHQTPGSLAASINNPVRQSAQASSALRPGISPTNSFANWARITAEQLEAVRLKNLHKGVRAAVIAADAPPLTPWVLWREEATLELLQWYKEVKTKFDELECVRPGYMNWLTYYNQSTPARKAYPLIADRVKDSLIRRYRVVMGVWKYWRYISAMHEDNAATGAYGHEEINTNMAGLVADLGSEGAGEEPNNNSDAVDAARDRPGKAGLTKAELALDPPSNADRDAPNPTASPALTHPAGMIPPIPSPQPLTRTPTSLPMPLAPHPPRAVELSARRRGRTELVKPDDTTSARVLMMMHKSQETTSLWMMEDQRRQDEDRRRQDELRADERAHAEKREDQKEATRAAALQDAQAARAIAEGHLMLERENPEQRAQAQEDNRRAHRRTTSTSDEVPKRLKRTQTPSSTLLSDAHQDLQGSSLSKRITDPLREGTSSAQSLAARKGKC
ncbi:hypothetical protein PTTG_05011 [Puccinia triticina 1-1 BBBD Race 1]|uniref:Uncharacterized protein n=1 Tax=Puccinia triticina (isolate 1-1 / race 1 (BBBD)) TaxID=630390 RepID=A0A180GPI1_PUCT1|nr:hypothetical protein PTTG_05011 [Puccinia triticina 1-1 BBBD Race 1]